MTRADCELPEVAAVAPDLGERLAELEPQPFEARESLRERDEQLEAVRALNQRRLLEHKRPRRPMTDT
jgi:hypothetical protein